MLKRFLFTTFLLTFVLTSSALAESIRERLRRAQTQETSGSEAISQKPRQVSKKTIGERCMFSKDCIEGFHCSAGHCTADEIILSKPSCGKSKEHPCENCKRGHHVCMDSSEQIKDNRIVECFMDLQCKDGYDCRDYECVSVEPHERSKSIKTKTIISLPIERVMLGSLEKESHGSYGIGRSCRQHTDCVQGAHCSNRVCTADTVLVSRRQCTPSPEDKRDDIQMGTLMGAPDLKTTCEDCIRGHQICMQSPYDFQNHRLVECFMDMSCNNGYQCRNYACVSGGQKTKLPSVSDIMIDKLPSSREEGTPSLSEGVPLSTKKSQSNTNPYGTCRDLPKKLRQCTTYECEMPHPFGIGSLAHRIKKMGGKCFWEEKMNDEVVLECALSKQFLIAIADQFAMQFDPDYTWGFSSEVGLSDDEPQVQLRIDGELVEDAVQSAIKSGECQQHVPPSPF